MSFWHSTDRPSRRLRADVVLVSVVAGLAVALCAPAVAGAEAGDLTYSAVFRGADADFYDSGVAGGVGAAGDYFAAGSCTLAADTGEAYLVRRGASNWAVPWAGTGDTSISDAVVDPAGGIFAVGGTTTATGGVDYLLVGHTALGDVSGTATYDGPAHRTDRAMAVARGTDGSVYVTGFSKAKDGDLDVVTIKYGPAGDRQWVRRYNGRSDDHDMGYEVFVRGTGLYVAGTTQRPGHGQDLLLLKYDAMGGALKWARSYDGSLHRGELPLGLVADGKSVYVAGIENSGLAGGGNAMLVRYTPSGWLKWAKATAGSRGGDDVWSDVAIALDGGAVVTGTLWRTATGDDVMTAAYTPDGVRAWRDVISSSGQQLDCGYALAIDPYGVTYVAGEVYHDPTRDTDGTVVCYSPDGGVVWQTSTIFPGRDLFLDVSLSSDAVWTTGSMTNPATGFDMLVSKFLKL
jgi:hypothetical protein